jgi:nitrite reductase/ring-hydroxylating ferredoxin subunit
VLFRTGAGDYGLVEQRCSHRGASLEYDVISENGITCAYHGFRYAPDGTILETGAGAPVTVGIVPVIQFAQGENGMHDIASRRVNDDLVWVRVLDAFMPNFGLIPPSDDGTTKKANIAQAAYIAAWIVPIDDENSKRLHLRFNDDRNPLRPVQRGRSYGQANDRPYAERQRYSGDYDMFVSQGPIAIHGYENLTPTDYGVIGSANSCATASAPCRKAATRWASRATRTTASGPGRGTRSCRCASRRRPKRTSNCSSASAARSPKAPTCTISRRRNPDDLGWGAPAGG